MNKIKIITNAISRTAGRGGLVVRKYSPEILMGAGIVGIVSSTVMACRATLKAGEVVENKNKKLDSIKQAKELADPKEYSEKDYKRDLTVTYVQTFVDYIKLYGPAVTLGVVSIGCMLGSYGIMRKRNVALIAAYKAVEESFNNYRKRVVEEFGAKKDYDLKHGIKQVEVTEMAYTDEDGVKHKEETKTLNVVDPSGISQYAKFFDESCHAWTKNADYNLTFLKCQQNYANDLLNSRGHVFLNEIYDMIGVPRTKAGQLVGWVRGHGDGFVDFGIFSGGKTEVRFVNGYEPVILLDFNVDGVIYDMI